MTSFLTKLKPNKPTANLEGYFISMLAPSKFGKTTFAIDLAKEFYGNLDTTLVMATEIGYKTMDGVFAIPITGFDYAENDDDDSEEKGFVETVDELIENKKDIPFRFIIIDTITALERYAIAYAIRKANRDDSPKTRYQDVSDVPWGKGYNMVAELIYEQIDRLKKAGFGVFIIGHSKMKKVKNKDGFEYDYTTFNVLGKTSDIIEREADMIIYGDLITEDVNGKVKTNRKLRFRSDGNILCGTRFRKFPDEIDSDVNVFIDTFKNAVLGLYDGNEKAVEKAKTEQKEELESKSEKFVEKQSVSLSSVIEEIDGIVANMEKDDKRTFAGKIKTVNDGDMDYRKVEDIKIAQKILEIAKNI